MSSSPLNSLFILYVHLLMKPGNDMVEIPPFHIRNEDTAPSNRSNSLSYRDRRAPKPSQTDGNIHSQADLQYVGSNPERYHTPAPTFTHHTLDHHLARASARLRDDALYEATLTRTLSRDLTYDRDRGNTHLTGLYSRPAADSNSSLGTNRHEMRHTHLQATSTRPSLSVFNSPTATYTWPIFQAASQMTQRPVLYVDYKKPINRPTSDSYLHSRTEHHIVDRRPPSEPPSDFSRRRRHSMEIPVSDPGPIQGIVEHFKDIHITVQTTFPRTSRDSPPDRQRFYPVEDMAQGPQRNGYYINGVNLLCEDREEDDTRAIRLYPEAPCEGGSSRSTDDDAEMTSASTDEQGKSQAKQAANGSNYDPEKWTEYAAIKGSLYKCLWPMVQGRRSVRCSYVARKHLVKRHIQTTHMKIKRWKCEYCDKRFPQKGSRDNHIYTHTGEKPYACRFGCGKMFNDPARRHRHMQEKHGYKAIRSRRKYRPESPPQDLSEYESMQPWRPGDSREHLDNPDEMSNLNADP